MVSDNYHVRFISSVCRLVRYWRKCQLFTETFNFLLMSSCVKPSNTKLKLVSLSCKIYISIKVKRLCTNQLAWNKNCFTSRQFFLSQLSIPWDLINHFRQYLENPISFTPQTSKCYLLGCWWLFSAFICSNHLRIFILVTPGT